MISALVLASASPARLQVLQRAGVAVSVRVSGVDESGVRASTTAELVAVLARLKCEAVVAESPAGDLAVIGCDSLLDLDGVPYGKPGGHADAVRAWQRMRGRTGTLLTGHHLVVRRGGAVEQLTATAATTVTFADLDDAEIERYVATGEPEHVAGAFTLDGYGGAFVERIDGDPHNVLGISLPLLRHMLANLGVRWTDLWSAT